MPHLHLYISISATPGPTITRSHNMLAYDSRSYHNHYEPRDSATIIRSTKMSEDELKLELAIALYKQELISSGKARAWTGLTVLEFQHELALARSLYKL